ncbi:MAG: hypothetical protein HFI65_03230 [Lachnospiraceae bacterium]|nr:hypothetical protein [Lachnospiraceae bacterium]
MKQLQDLNLLDDFLFGTLVAHPNFQEPFSRNLAEEENKRLLTELRKYRAERTF